MTSAVFPLKLAPNLEKSSESYFSLDDIEMELSSYKALAMVGRKKKVINSCSSCCKSDLIEISTSSAYAAKRRAGVVDAK